MAHAFPGGLRRSLIATAAVVLLGTVGYATGTVIAYFIGQILRVMAGQ